MYDHLTGRVWLDHMVDGVTWAGIPDACGPGYRVPRIEELRSLFVNCPALEEDGDCPIHSDCAANACEDENLDLCANACGEPVDNCYWSQIWEDDCVDALSATETNLAGLGGFKQYYFAGFLEGIIKVVPTPETDPPTWSSFCLQDP